jgi:hypothetical protein
VDAVKLLVFLIIDKIIRNTKFFCMFEATSYYHNVFTFTLFILERRVGVAWETSNKMMLFLPTRKLMCLTSPLDFFFHLLFIYPSYISLSLSLVFSRFRNLFLTSCRRHSCVTKLEF